MMAPRRRTYRRRARRGTILIYTLGSLMAIGAFLAFSVDVGLIASARAELQNAADAAALAGARALAESPASARAAAADYAARNSSHSAPVVLTAADVELGDWNPHTATFTPQPPSSEHLANAVRVTAIRSSARGTQLDLFIGGMLGKDFVDVQAQSIALVKGSDCGRFVGIDDFTMSSGVTDSYDSRLGSYASQTPSDEGHICGNGDLLVKSNVTVHGDAACGQGSSITGAGHITGDRRSRRLVSYPAASAGSADVSNDNSLLDHKAWHGDRISVPSNKSYDFPGGVLYAHRLSISGELRIQGPTVIYVEDKMDISGDGIVNQSQRPADLRIVLLADDGRNSTLSGSSDVHAVIYAPGAEVSLTGGAAFYGAITAGDLKLTNSGGCHYDESLKPSHRALAEALLVQ